MSIHAIKRIVTGTRETLEDAKSNGDNDIMNLYSESTPPNFLVRIISTLKPGIGLKGIKTGKLNSGLDNGSDIDMSISKPGVLKRGVTIKDDSLNQTPSAPAIPVSYDTTEKVEVIKSNPSDGFIPEEIKLSELDLSRPYSWDTVLHGFKNDSEDPNFMSLERLKSSLAEALKYLPILAGELDKIETNSSNFSSKAVVKLNNRGVWLAATQTGMNFDNVAQTHLNQHALPGALRFRIMERTMGVPFQPKEKQAPLFAVKIVYFPCGSVSVTSLMCHLVADFNARMDFMKLWGSLFRGESNLSKLIDNRNFLKPQVSDISKSLAKEWSSYRCPHASSASELNVCFVSVKNEKILELANQVNYNLSDASQMVRPDDIFNAIIWRAMSRARGLFPEETTSYARIVDVRKSCGMESMFCNAIIPTPPLPLTVGQLLSIPVGDVASQLWRKETRVNNTFIKDYVGALSLVKQKGRPLWKLSNPLQQNCFSISLNNQTVPVSFSSPAGIWFRETPLRDGSVVTYPPLNGVRTAQVCLYKFHTHKFLNDPEFYQEKFDTHSITKIESDL